MMDYRPVHGGGHHGGHHWGHYGGYHGFGGFGVPFVGGLLGGLAASAISSPSYGYPYPPPVPILYPTPTPYYPYGGYPFY